MHLPIIRRFSTYPSKLTTLRADDKHSRGRLFQGSVCNIVTGLYVIYPQHHSFISGFKNDLVSYQTWQLSDLASRLSVILGCLRGQVLRTLIKDDLSNTFLMEQGVTQDKVHMHHFD